MPQQPSAPQPSPTPPRGRGRPRKLRFDPDTIARIEAYAYCGLDQQEIAHCLGIAPSTLSENLSQHAVFSDAVKRGRARGVSYVAGKLLERIREGNVAATIFFLKARANWSDTRITLARDVVPVVEELDDADLTRLALGAINAHRPRDRANS